MKFKFLPLLLIIIGFNTQAQNPGTLDLSFDPGFGTNTVVEAIAIQPDGKILIGGPFSLYDSTAINGIARLNTDGSLDTTFDPGAGVMGYVQGQQYHVYAIAIQTDGKILLGGAFHNFDNTPRDRIVRLNADGSLDNTFDPGDGADGEIRTMAIQGDGKILIGGSFSRYYSLSNLAPSITRINTDGTIDNSFSPGDGANSSINSLAIQGDGKIVIGGDFTSYDGTALNRIARINSDGSLDTGFDPGTGSDGTFPSIRTVKVQNDGKIIAAGYFDSFDGNTRRKIARLNSNGNFDASFDPGSGADLNAIHRVEILSGGNLIILGGFYNYDGISRNSIARISSNGALDTIFDPGFGCNNTGEALAIQSDGKILIGGNFTQYDGTLRNHIARVHNDQSTSIIEGFGKETFTVFPNPSNGIMQVVSSNTSVPYRIIDLNGVVVKEWNSSLNIDLVGYSTGMYFLQTEAGNVIRLVKY